ncbi:phage baseplate assembly protein domain-containing protein [Aureimonas altamirensis]|uniref:phage baseplate assembly protein domain-containing protein n=1 Tax=Aureimonas altamirensis TaxID=370622 RepID=UPI00057D1983|nr:phage baseplate assembly protein [Aureimonas altamirensis]
MASDANVTRMLLDGGVKHNGGQQFLSGKGLAGERFPRVHRLEPHGFTSHPVAGGIATILQSRNSRDSVYAMGGANPGLVPSLDQGGTAIYDHLGNIVSIVMSEMRIVHATKIVIEAPEIVLTGMVKLGGEDASRPASAIGTIDTGGFVDAENPATMVLVK